MASHYIIPDSRPVTQIGSLLLVVTLGDENIWCFDFKYIDEGWMRVCEFSKFIILWTENMIQLRQGYNSNKK